MPNCAFYPQLDILSLSSLMCSHIFYTVFHAVFPTFSQQCPNSVPTVCPQFPLSFQKVSPKFPIHFPQFPLSLPSGPQKFPLSFPTVTPTVYYTVSPQYALSSPTVSLQYPNCFPTFSQPYNLPPPPDLGRDSAASGDNMSVGHSGHT